MAPAEADLYDEFITGNYTSIDSPDFNDDFNDDFAAGDDSLAGTPRARFSFDFNNYYEIY